MTKPKRKIYLELDKELKEKLQEKAEGLGLSFPNFLRMVLKTSLKGELQFNQ